MPLYDDSGTDYDALGILYTPSVLHPAPKSIEAWVTTPAGSYIAHLDRSDESPFRNFAVSLIRNQPGSGSLEYHPDNATLREHPTLFNLGNLVHMHYRGKTRTWIIEDVSAVLDENEHASDWVKVSGRGALQLLGHRIVFPPGFNSGANLNPASWASQWRTVDNRPAGEMLWDLISESNPRFATQITRGTVEVAAGGTDGVTTALRFDNLLTDVVEQTTAIHGDVEMDGLTFNYYVAQGTDKSSAVIFEEGADLESLNVDKSDRERVSYIVGEGVGEGVFATLAVASRADALRIEGFLAAKDADNVPLLQAQTKAALNEHIVQEQVGFEVLETRFRALEDYDLGDRVRVIAPSRGVNKVDRIDAIYLVEDGDRVRAAIDVAGLREDELLNLDRRESDTASSLGVRNRYPQGQLTFADIHGNGVFDSDNPFVCDFMISSRIFLTVETELLFAFSEFWAPATAASSGGGATSGSGGSSTPTSSTQDAHGHEMMRWINNTGLAASKRGFQVRDGAGTAFSANIETDIPNASVFTYGPDGGHSHSVTVPAHDHSTPAHVHGLTYGVFAEPMPSSHSVNVGVYKRSGSSWSLVVSLSGLTDDMEELDLTQYIDGPGSWRLQIQSAASQPQNGRLAVSVSGVVTGAIASS